MNTINSAAVGEPSAFRSWVDQPSTGTLASPRVVVRGWCYHRGGLPITGIRADVGGRRFIGLHGDPRPDVHAVLGGAPTSDTSGFEIAVHFPAGPSVCRLEAQVPDGEWQTFQSFAVTAPARPFWSERRQRLRFWMDAWLGRPAIWAELPPDDRDFMVAWARHRGWLNLQLAPQYPPRPVVPESFPRAKIPRAALPRIAIVTPSYNQAPFLEATMRSVLEQEGVDIDYVVQDGGSTDGSVDLIRRHAHRLKHWESARDRGQADAVARGFAHVAAGPDDVMMYLNSDDLLMPGAARFAAEYFAAHPEVDVLYGHRVLIDDDGLEVGRWYTPRRGCDDLRLHDLVPQETLFWRRRAWERAGGVDASFQFALDWDLLLRFAAVGARFARIPRFLGMFRLHAQQKSQARLNEHGIPEMERLRLRTLGRPPTADEMHCSMRRAQFDSALLLALWRRGVRV